MYVPEWEVEHKSVLLQQMYANENLQKTLAALALLPFPCQPGLHQNTKHTLPLQTPWLCPPPSFSLPLNSPIPHSTPLSVLSMPLKYGFQKMLLFELMNHFSPGVVEGGGGGRQEGWEGKGRCVVGWRKGGGALINTK